MKFSFFLLSISILVGCRANDSSQAFKANNRDNPKKLELNEPRVLLGASLAGGDPGTFNATVGFKHALFLEFFRFPEILTDPGLRAHIDGFVQSVIVEGGIPILTLETFGGLTSYSQEQIEALAEIFSAYKHPLVLRWNHEMNGSWYPWGQQPELYREKFREFAKIMRERAPQVSMAWTPNQEFGYPFPGLAYANSSLDPNAPYLPYYPGDDVVDIVGISLYHWGVDAKGKTGHNTAPSSDEWEVGLRMFHDTIARRFNKPMMIAETAALYNPNDASGPSDLEIKLSWLKQVYNVDTLKNKLPQLKAILWFNVIKTEEETGGKILWSFDYLPPALAFYRNMAQDPYFVKADQLP